MRRSALSILSAAARLLPPHLAAWSRAMECEAAHVPSDGEALRFAAGCLRAAFAILLAARLRAACDLLFPSSPRFRSLVMNGMFARPRLLGLLCGAAAVGLGLAYMSVAGAPSRYLLMNVAALVIGATAWLALGGAARSRLAWAGMAVLALAVLLLLTALVGPAFDGAARWISVGPFNLQVSFVALPAMVVLYARRPDAIGTAGMVVAAVALAIQPDRAMAGVLIAGLIGPVLVARSRLAMLATAAAVPAFGWTLLMPDTLPAVPYVDRILYTAFDVHPLAGVAVLSGAAALAAPALPGLFGAGRDRAALLAFAGCWVGVVAAAAMGNYPTPLVGYGGSAVLGYLLSVAVLPSGARADRGAGRLEASSAGRNGSDRSTSELRVMGAA